MIKVYARVRTAQAEESATTQRAANGLRLAAATLGRTLSQREADTLMEQLVGDNVLFVGGTNSQKAADGAIRIASGYGLALYAEGEPDTEPDLIPEEVPARDDAPQEYPSYLAGLLALTMMAAGNGSAGAATRLTNTIRHAYKQEDEDHEIWDDVLRCLFDAFPVHDVQGDITELAAEVGR